MSVRAVIVAAALVASLGVAGAEERKEEERSPGGAPLESIADEVAEVAQDERHMPEQSGMSRAVAETNETEFEDQCKGSDEMLGCGDVPD